MADSPRNRYDKTVFFFNSSTNFMHKTGQLKGRKLKSKDEDKLITLKTKFLQRSNMFKIKSSFQQEQPKTQRQIIHNIGHTRYRSLSKYYHPEKRQIIEDSDMIITSESNSLPKQKRSRDLPHFESSNLEGKMNEYLNLIIRKSHQNHQERVKQIMEGEKQQKSHKVQNMFFRRMKISQNRKKQDKERDEHSIESEGRTMRADDMISNLKQLLKKPQIHLEQIKH